MVFVAERKKHTATFTEAKRWPGPCNVYKVFSAAETNRSLWVERSEPASAALTEEAGRAAVPVARVWP